MCKQPPSSMRPKRRRVSPRCKQSRATQPTSTQRIPSRSVPRTDPCEPRQGEPREPTAQSAPLRAHALKPLGCAPRDRHHPTRLLNRVERHASGRPNREQLAAVRHKNSRAANGRTRSAAGDLLEQPHHCAGLPNRRLAVLRELASPTNPRPAPIDLARSDAKSPPLPLLSAQKPSEMLRRSVPSNSPSAHFRARRPPIIPPTHRPEAPRNPLTLRPKKRRHKQHSATCAS